MTHDSRDREFARSLFTGQRADDQERETDTTANHVPREGDGNGTTRDPEHADRNFAGALFGVDENARNLRTTRIY